MRTMREIHQRIKWAQEGKGKDGVQDILRSYAQEVERETREEAEKFFEGYAGISMEWKDFEIMRTNFRQLPSNIQ